MDGPIVLAWAKDIERLAPMEDLEKLPFLMDCFKTNRIPWDKTIGIQNFFVNFKFIRKEENGRFKILTGM